MRSVAHTDTVSGRLGRQLDVVVAVISDAHARIPDLYCNGYRFANTEGVTAGGKGEGSTDKLTEGGGRIDIDDVDRVAVSISDLLNLECTDRRKCGRCAREISFSREYIRSICPLSRINGRGCDAKART